jgi:putative DNA primase/helicase
MVVRKVPPLKVVVDTVFENRTDTGNAKRMAALYADKIRYCPTFKAWYVWDGRIWARDTSLEIMKLAKATVRTMTREAVLHPDDEERRKRIQHCLSAESTAKLRAMVENAQSELVLRPEEMDADPYLLCVENGTLDLRTGKLRRHDPADFITLMAPVEFLPAATDDRWEELLKRFVRDDDGKEEFLRRAAFASLTGTTSDKVFINLYDDNDGNTGKTTFIESLIRVWGPYAAIVNAESFLSKAHGSPGIRSDIAALAGKRLVVSSETPPGRKLDTALMKKLTQGGGKYQFERKFENPWEGDITFTIWLDGNSVAKANAEDSPLFDRWRLTPFKHKFVGKPDKRWLERAAASPEFRAAVLAWVVAGRRTWLADGVGSAPSVDKAGVEVRETMDPLRDFWEQCCRFGSDAYFTPSALLMERYETWCLGQPGAPRPINKASFEALLKSRGAMNKPRRVDGRLVRGWAGVQLRKPFVLKRN